jgi:hypothetical protein
MDLQAQECKISEFNTTEVHNDRTQNRLLATVTGSEVFNFYSSPVTYIYYSETSRPEFVIFKITYKFLN